MSVWVYECMCVWVYGCMGVSMCVFEHLCLCVGVIFPPVKHHKRAIYSVLQHLNAMRQLDGEAVLVLWNNTAYFKVTSMINSYRFRV